MLFTILIDAPRVRLGMNMKFSYSVSFLSFSWVPLMAVPGSFAIFATSCADRRLLYIGRVIIATAEQEAYLAVGIDSPAGESSPVKVKAQSPNTPDIPVRFVRVATANLRVVDCFPSNCLTLGGKIKFEDLLAKFETYSTVELDEFLSPDTEAIDISTVWRKAQDATIKA